MAVIVLLIAILDPLQFLLRLLLLLLLLQHVTEVPNLHSVAHLLGLTVSRLDHRIKVLSALSAQDLSVHPLLVPKVETTIVNRIALSPPHPRLRFPQSRTPADNPRAPSTTETRIIHPNVRDNPVVVALIRLAFVMLGPPRVPGIEPQEELMTPLPATSLTDNHHEMSFTH